MHEFGIVNQLIAEFTKTRALRGARKVKTARIRYGPGLSEDSLRQAFKVQSAGTLLEGARLEFEKKLVLIPCDCGANLTPPTVGYSHEHKPNHVQGGDYDPGMPYLVCQQCHHVYPIPGFNVLELIHAS